MALLDWSAAPRAPSMAPGFSLISDALDAVMQRREQEAKEKQAQAAKLAYEQMVNAREQQRIEEEKRHNRAGEKLTEDKQTSEAERAKQASEDARTAKVNALVQAGLPSLAAQYMPQAPGPAAPTTPQPQAAPIEPPPFQPAAPSGEPTGNEPAPMAPAAAPAPAPAPAPPINPMDALLQKVKSDRKRMADEVVATLGPAGSGPVHEAALKSTAASVESGILPRERAAEYYKATVEAELNRRATHENALLGAGTRANTADRMETRQNVQDKRLAKGELDSFDSKRGIKETEKRWNELNRIGATIKGNGPAAQAQAVMELDRAVKGGTLTKSSLDYFASHLSGGLGTLQTAIQKVQNGEYGNEAITNVVRALNASKMATRAEAGQQASDFGDAFFDESHYPMKANFESEWRSRFGKYGFKLPGEKGAPGINAAGQAYKSSGGEHPTGGDAERRALLQEVLKKL